MEHPVITTIIPTFRRPALLPRAVTSVLSQTYPGVRAVICDNASGDETGKVAADLMRTDARVQYRCHETNIGPYANFNSGIKRVSTPFFSLLSDDDFLVPDFYERALRCFVQYPAAGFVCMPTMVIDERGKVISPPMLVTETRQYAPHEGFAGLVNGTLPNTWTGIVFRKEVADAIGLIDTDVGPFADGGYVWRAGARFLFVVSTGVAAVLVSHKISTSGTTPPLSGEWPVWRKRMVESALNGEAVPPILRQNAAVLVPLNYRTIGFLQVMQYLTSGRVHEAALAAGGLRACGYPISSAGLLLLVRLSAGAPVLLRMFKAVRQFRKRRIGSRTDRIHDQYSHILGQCAYLQGKRDRASTVTQSDDL
jgi:glycosyltransferase involved in cell wall biosynthesis